MSIAGREHGHEYHVNSHADILYILSNRNGVNFSLFTAEISKPKDWTELIPHRVDTKLEWTVTYDAHLIIGGRHNGLEQVQVYGLNGDSHLMSFPDPVYDITPGKNPMNDSTIFRFHYSSPICPPTVYDYDFITKELTIIKRDEIPGGFNPADYIVERHFAKAEDGVLVPLSILRKKDIILDGKAPAFMVGYGSYGFPMPTTFSSSLISLLNRGFVCARAHIRGGSDMGEQWYLDGKLQKKKNTFTDFIACAEYLIEKRFTSKEKLAVQGGSAGGLLMGAIANMRPDLFHTIIASVPFVDLMNTMLDASLPLTVAEYEEWGNPNVREDFEYMLSYSPYDNIAHQDYPNILAIGGYHDQRVSYWEPSKWIARLRDHNTGNSTILLYTKFTAGHFGASGRFDYLKELALEYAFILKYSELS
jgi:oligopeptidase B